MNGPILDIDPTSIPATRSSPADTRDAPPVLDQIGAAFRTGLDEEELIQAQRLGNEYNAIATALEERGVPRSRFTRGTAPDPQVLARGMGSVPADIVKVIDRDAVWREIARARQADPQAFSELQGDRASHDRWVLRRGEARTRDQQLLERGEGIGSFAAGIVGGGAASFADPINIATLPLGGGGKTIAMRIITEALVNAGVEAVQTPGMIAARSALGEDTTARDIALNIGGAAVAGGAIRGGLEVAPRIGAAIATRVTGATAQERTLAKAFADAVPENLRTPEQAAALQILTREADVEDINPFPLTHDAIDAHKTRLAEAMAGIEQGRLARSAAPPPPTDLGVRVVPSGPAAGGPGVRADFAQAKAAIRAPESAGNDTVVNQAGSSAAGRYQFIESTFVGLYRRVFNVSPAEAQRAWNRNRFDVAVQERLMDRLLADNAKVLENAGVTADTGNLYLAHFAGAGRAARLIEADPAAPVSRFFSQKEIAQNPSYLGGGKTVGEAIAIIRGIVGDGPGGGTRLPSLQIDDGTPVVRSAALDAERPVIPVSTGQAITMQSFRAADIGVDAQLMQFKSGGDEFGVTDRLRGVQEWDPIAAGTVTVWESADGRRLIADGHQRLGLARRVETATGQEVMLNAFVLREADGFSARDARIRTALKNIGEGTGTAVDAAKVVREAGPEFADAIARRLPPRGAVVRDGKALAQLDDEAFGAVINEVIPEQYGAAIAQLVPDRAQHMAMVRVLAETAPANRLQAEAIIRQARDAGFSTETQDSLFGGIELTTSLFAARARVLDRTLVELRKLKGAFGVAARNAEALDSAGNRIDVAASTAAAADNGRALALVERLALRKGNAVNEIFTDAARRIGDGEQLAPVVRDIVRELRTLDLDGLERAAADGSTGGRGADGRLDADGDGRAGKPALEDRIRDGDSQLTPAEIDEATEAGLFGPPDPAAPLLRAFDDQAGDGVRLTAESTWHDIRARADNPAPARPGGERTDAAKVDEEPIFDMKLDLEDGLGLRTHAEIEAEIRAERAAIDEIRKCL